MENVKIIDIEIIDRIEDISKLLSPEDCFKIVVSSWTVNKFALLLGLDPYRVIDKIML